MSDLRRQLPHPPEVPERAPDEPPGLFDRPKTIRMIQWIACIAVVALFVLDFFLPYHEWFGLERVPGFYTIFGFVASVLLIASAKIGGKPLKREEDAYDG